MTQMQKLNFEKHGSSLKAIPYMLRKAKFLELKFSWISPTNLSLESWSKINFGINVEDMFTKHKFAKTVNLQF